MEVLRGMELTGTNRSRSLIREREVKERVPMCNFESSEGTGLEREREEKILDSSMVEHPAVNRRVVGSSPTRGGKR